MAASECVACAGCFASDFSIDSAFTAGIFSNAGAAAVFGAFKEALSVVKRNFRKTHLPTRNS